MARELLELGHVAAALAQAEACAREAPSEPASPDRDTFVAWCRDRARELERRVARVVVEVPSLPSGMEVTVGGRSLSLTATNGRALAAPHGEKSQRPAVGSYRSHRSRR